MEEILKLANFPYPDRVRENFYVLNGIWKFEFDPKNIGLKNKWFKKANFSKTINVPYPVESEASGIGEKVPTPVFWYAKEFTLDENFSKNKILLNFGAVDYKARVYLNGNYLGEHIGGYTPFSFEIEKFLKEKNLLVLRCEDKRSLTQIRGKQTFLKKSFLIFYTSVSGIWQPVWLEFAGKIYLKNFKLSYDFEKKKIIFNLLLAGENGRAKIEMKIKSLLEEYFKEFEFEKKFEKENILIEFELKDFLLWEPENPSLYFLEFKINSEDSQDCVKSYFGIRKIEIKERKIYLNGKELYQRLILNQGYFKDGIYTPIDEEEYRKDVELIKEVGFNGIRMHQKIENKKFLFWCDYLGLLVWAEMPSAYLFSKKMRKEYELQLEEFIERDYNHPSIIVWVPFNESWGVSIFPFPVILLKSAKNFVKYIFKKIKEKDQSRLVIDNSGYDHTSLTDIVDIHHYLENTKRCEKFYEDLKNPKKMKFSIIRLLKSYNPGKSPQNTFTWGESYKNQPIIISEYGGFGFYKCPEKTILENFQEYTYLIKKQKHIQGYCYTQFTDVEQEKNGLFEIDRRPKEKISEIRKINLDI
jgi:beta-galactosidase/beta-glucuronidase